MTYGQSPDVRIIGRSTTEFTTGPILQSPIAHCYSAVVLLGPPTAHRGGIKHGGGTTRTKLPLMLELPSGRLSILIDSDQLRHHHMFGGVHRRCLAIQRYTSDCHVPTSCTNIRRSYMVHVSQQLFCAVPGALVSRPFQS